MLKTLARRLVHAASWRRLGLLIPVYAVFIGTLTTLENRIKRGSGGLGVPDLIFGFSADDLHARLDAFGPEGRRLYAYAELVDLVYPLVYAVTFATVLALAVKRLFGEESRAALVTLLPFAALVADYVENAGIFATLSAWPARAGAAESIASMGNHLKWALAGPAVVLMGIGLAATAIAALFAKR
jgi:hypothetical protein